MSTRTDLAPKYNQGVYTTPEEQMAAKVQQETGLNLQGGITQTPGPFGASTPKTDVAGKKTPGPIQTFQDAGTGINSGIQFPNGDTYFGLSPQEIARASASYQAARTPPPGTVTVAAAKQQEQLLQQNSQLASQVGNTQSANAPSPQTAPIDFLQAGGTGLAAALPGLASAGAGALLGAEVGAIGGPVGSLLGAGTGAVIEGLGLAHAIAHFLAGTKENIKAQVSGQITANTANLRKREGYLRALVTDTNHNPAHAAENLQLFNYQLALIDKEEAQLKSETDSRLNKFTGVDGAPELAKYMTFNSRGGSRGFLSRAMQTALLNPNPNASLISIQDLQDLQGPAA